MNTKTERRFLANVQTEVDANYLYKKIAAGEEDETVSRLFNDLAGIEQEHAEKMLSVMHEQGYKKPMPGPSFRARTLNMLGRILGYDYIIGVMTDIEKSISNAQIKGKQEQHVPLQGSETNHVNILESLIKNKAKITGEKLSKIEGRHKSIGGNALRAAVLGANDGLVSNMSLVMGVAGATGGESQVLLAGIAGLLAGALSMALGEWISVKSSQELNERQMELEMVEIENNPEGEVKELTLIYMAKGIPEDKAAEMAHNVMSDKDHAHEVLVKEELGINPDEMGGSPWEAAFASFFLFAIGAILPVIPYFWIGGFKAVIYSLSLSTLGLFIMGAAITLFTGKSVWHSGFRQIIFGLAAAAITFGIGHIIGASIAG